MQKLKDFFVLSKFVLSFAVTLSAVFSFVMASGGLDERIIIPTLSILLLAMGVSAMNQYQEYEEDSKMQRTKNRPIASGRMRPFTGLVISFVLISSALWLMYNALGFFALNLSIIAFIWYNGVYTKMKKISSLAVVPGAILGVIPPAIGWLAAGHSLAEIEFLALGLFFFVWQVPHFWLLMMLHNKDYINAGFPTTHKLFGKKGLNRVIFVWLVLTIQCGLYTIAVFDIQSIYILAALMLIVVLALRSSVRLIQKGFEYKQSRLVFNEINLFLLSSLVLISVDSALI